jgi:hypothetical protein
VANSRTHSLTALVNHTRQVPASAAAAGISASVYKPHSEQSCTRVPDERLSDAGKPRAQQASKLETFGQRGERWSELPIVCWARWRSRAAFAVAYQKGPGDFASRKSNEIAHFSC